MHCSFSARSVLRRASSAACSETCTARARGRSALGTSTVEGAGSGEEHALSFLLVSFVVSYVMCLMLLQPKFCGMHSVEFRFPCGKSADSTPQNCAFHSAKLRNRQQ